MSTFESLPYAEWLYMYWKKLPVNSSTAGFNQKAIEKLPDAPAMVDQQSAQEGSRASAVIPGMLSPY